MTRRTRFSAAVVLGALVLGACAAPVGSEPGGSSSGGIGPGGIGPGDTGTSSAEPTPSQSARPDVAPEITTTNFVEDSNPGAWIFNEYGNGSVTEFDVPGDDVLCALHGDYAISANELNREVRGWYLPTQELAWQLSDMTCPSDGFVPQRITQGAVLGTPTDEEHSGLLVEFSTGETILDIPTLDPDAALAPMPLGVSGEILVLNQDGSLYGINQSGKLMWDLPAKGRTWSKNMMTGHVFGIRDRRDVMVVNGVTGQVVLETTVPEGRPLIQTAGGFMYQEDPDGPYTFVTLDGTTSTLDESFTGARYVPRPLSGALFPLNLYLNPDAGPIFDSNGNPAPFDIDLESFQREGTAEEPQIMAVSADGEHVLVDDRGGTMYAVNQQGEMVWYLDALRPWVLGSYIVAEFGVGNDRIVIPNFDTLDEDSSKPQ